ncbi:MAG TPA: polymer-forming cytoskeletal protein [Steroidobacteraceae bacterium]
MALWKEQTPGSGTSFTPKDPAAREPERPAAVPLNQERRPRERSEPKESLIAVDLTIDGKIEGSGHVRIAGRFKGDINVQGNLTIDAGAHVTGQVRAHTVTLGGELNGNIEAAARVELLETGVLSGDVKAGSLIVAAGSRMRGQVEFGWAEQAARVIGSSKGEAAAS